MRDIGCERQSGRPALPSRHAHQQKEARRRGKHDHGRSLEDRRRFGRELQRLDDRVDQQEAEQADGHCQQEIHRRLAPRRAAPDRTSGRPRPGGCRRRRRAAPARRGFADVTTGVGTATAISWSNVAPVLVTKRHLVRLAQHPWKRHADPGRVATRDRPRRILRELPIGGVDLHLRDRHRLRSAGPHQQTKPVLVEDRALDRQALDRRRAVVEARQRIGRIEPGDGQAEHGERRQQPEKIEPPARRRTAVAADLASRDRRLCSFTTPPPRRRTCPSSRVR